MNRPRESTGSSEQALCKIKKKIKKNVMNRWGPSYQYMLYQQAQAILQNTSP